MADNMQSQNENFALFQCSCDKYNLCSKCVLYFHENGGIPNCFSPQRAAMLEIQREEKERLEKEKLEAELKEKERLEKEKLAAELKEKERLEKENKFIPSSANPMYIEVFFRCCSVYGKLYLNIKETYYVGKCPRCKSKVTAPMGSEMPRFGLRQNNLLCCK